MSANSSPTAASGGSGRWIIAAVLILVAVAAGAAVAVSQSSDDTSAGAPGTTTPGTAPATDGADELTGDEATATTALDSSPASMDPVHIFADDVLLGSWTGGQWTANPEVAPALDGSVVSYVDGEQIRESTVVGPPETWCEAFDDPSWYVTLGSSSPTLGGLYGMTNLTWNPRPQSVTDIAPSAAHLEAAADALAQAGLPGAEIVISRIVRLDIEGDGVDEVILTAEVGEPDFYGSQVGDYSVMILRQVNDSEQVDNLVLGVHVTTGSEPGAESAEDLGASPGVITVNSTYFGFVDAIDLNGDGTLELLTTQSGYEWFWRDVIDTSSGRPELVLNSGCGA